ncbi:hypothetical protein FPV67DRAFT_624292 [Lyophyllum atratum]|nr:hypothetical protein FPV67DRAFT_624292 [Lyophyllum atratum]
MLVFVMFCFNSTFAATTVRGSAVSGSNLIAFRRHFRTAQTVRNHLKQSCRPIHPLVDSDDVQRNRILGRLTGLTDIDHGKDAAESVHLIDATLPSLHEAISNPYKGNA